MTQSNTKLVRFTKLIILLTCISIFSCSKKDEKQVDALEKVSLEGFIQGTTYHITYMHPSGRDFHEEIKQVMTDFNKTFSIYDSLSLISRINRNEKFVLNKQFIEVFTRGQEISKKTDGAFDMTVSPLVKLWGFNNAKRQTVSQHMIDSVKQNIGYQKIRLENNKIIKDKRGIQLDANAIAQGYTSDLIAELLDKKGIKNYMVEIGGEVRCKGNSPRGDLWKLGINEPVEDSTNTNNEIREIIHVSNMAVSTSGSYRKFYMHKGKKYSHEIDPKTGYPVTHGLVSVTVLAPDCMTADAYATAFMVMGTVKSIRLLQKLPGVEAYLIYRDNNGKLKDVYTRGFWKYLEKNQTKH